LKVECDSKQARSRKRGERRKESERRVVLSERLADEMLRGGRGL
jgi:hypothetical protein